MAATPDPGCGSVVGTGAEDLEGVDAVPPCAGTKEAIGPLLAPVPPGGIDREDRPGEDGPGGARSEGDLPVAPDGAAGRSAPDSMFVPAKKGKGPGDRKSRRELLISAPFKAGFSTGPACS